MNKEEIEHIQEIKKMLNFTTEGTSLRINNEVSKLLFKYIKELEQKSEKLDNVRIMLLDESIADKIIKLGIKEYIKLKESEEK